MCVVWCVCGVVCVAYVHSYTCRHFHFHACTRMHTTRARIPPHTPHTHTRTCTHTPQLSRKHCKLTPISTARGFSKATASPPGKSGMGTSGMGISSESSSLELLELSELEEETVSSLGRRGRRRGRRREEDEEGKRDERLRVRLLIWRRKQEAIQYSMVYIVHTMHECTTNILWTQSSDMQCTLVHDYTQPLFTYLSPGSAEAMMG